MADTTEIQQAKKWIYDSLVADAQLVAIVSTRIYADRAPATPTFPYVLYNLMASSDIQGVGVVRQASTAVFQIRYVTNGTPDANARKADYRINVVFGAAISQLSGDFRFTSWRSDTIDRAEYDQLQNRYHNLGGLYRLWIAPA